MGQTTQQKKRQDRTTAVLVWLLVTLVLSLIVAGGLYAREYMHQSFLAVSVELPDPDRNEHVIQVTPTPRTEDRTAAAAPLTAAPTGQPTPTVSPAPTAAPTPTTAPDPLHGDVIGTGMSAPIVRDIQIRLMSLDYMDFQQPEEVYGTDVARAVALFQRCNGLPETGLCDEATYIKLNDEDAASFAELPEDGEPAEDFREGFAYNALGVMTVSSRASDAQANAQKTPAPTRTPKPTVRTGTYVFTEKTVTLEQVLKKTRLKLAHESTSYSAKVDHSSKVTLKGNSSFSAARAGKVTLTAAKSFDKVTLTVSYKGTPELKITLINSGSRATNTPTPKATKTPTPKPTKTPKPTNTPTPKATKTPRSAVASVAPGKAAKVKTGTYVFTGETATLEQVLKKAGLKLEHESTSYSAAMDKPALVVLNDYSEKFSAARTRNVKLTATKYFDTATLTVSYKGTPELKITLSNPSPAPTSTPTPSPSPREGQVRKAKYAFTGDTITLEQLLKATGLTLTHDSTGYSAAVDKPALIELNDTSEKFSAARTRNVKLKATEYFDKVTLTVSYKGTPELQITLTHTAPTSTPTPPAVMSTEPPGGSYSSGVEGLIAAAQSRVGCPYVRAGKGPDGFDCSGFVYWCLKQAGVNVSYMTSIRWRTCTQFTRFTDMSELKRGDILVFSGSSSSTGHVGIYLGGGKMIDAGSSSGCVKVRSSIYTSYWQEHFLMAYHIW